MANNAGMLLGKFSIQFIFSFFSNPKEQHLSHFASLFCGNETRENAVPLGEQKSPHYGLGSPNFKWIADFAVFPQGHFPLRSWRRNVEMARENA
jgi:hypothetical protein